MNTADHQGLDLWAEELAYVLRTGKALLSGVDFAVRSGRITGVLGPNGAGKSTLLRAVIGALQPSAGQMYIGEARESSARQALGSLPRLERARLLAMVEQDAHPHDDLTAAEVIALGRLPHQGRFGGNGDDDVARAAAARAGVEDLWGRTFSTLSGGERQRVHLARALAQTPRILLLDEPTNHLDIAAQMDLLRLVRDVAEEGAGVLLTLHDLTLAARICDDVVILNGGRVVATGAPLEVLTPELIEAVWGVRAQWVEGGGAHALVYA